MGASYSTVSTTRSILSAFIPESGDGTIGSQPETCRLVKDVFQERPALRKHADTWDFCSLPPTEKWSLKQLTLRTAMLLALFTGQRGHALHSLKFSDIHMSSNKCSLHFSSKRKHTWPAEILSFEQDRKLCFVDYLHVYIENTATLRSGHELFFSFHKPYACFTLLSRWLALKQPSPQRGEQWPLRIVHNACRELLCSSQRKVEPDRCSEGGRMHVTKYIHSVLQQDCER